MGEGLRRRRAGGRSSLGPLSGGRPDCLLPSYHCCRPAFDSMFGNPQAHQRSRCCPPPGNSPASRALPTRRRTRTLIEVMAAVPACFIFDEAMSRPVHISNFSSHRLSHKPRPPKAAAKRGPPQTMEDILGAAVQVAKAKLTDASTYQKPVAGTMRRASNFTQECVICCKPVSERQKVRPCEACAEENVCCISCFLTRPRRV